MKSLINSGTLTRSLVSFAALTLAGGALVGCSHGSTDPAASCQDYQYGATRVNPDNSHSGPFGLDLVLIDLYSNSASTASVITSAVDPYLADAISNGAYVKIELDGGSGTSLQISDCFDGTKPYLVTRANTTRQEKDQTSATTDLDSALTEAIESVRVAEHGSATRLLQGASQEVIGIKAASPEPVGKVRVLLWSNLLGNTDGSDCLDVVGMTATPAYATAIATRCFSEGQLSHIPGASMRILGVGTGAVNRQQTLLADDLGAALCAKFGDGCQASQG